MNVDQAAFEAIAKAIHSDDSPVGIDAKKTHIIILDKLLRIEERLGEIQAQLDKLNKA